ncbi:hypothetical protein HRbin04_00378 [archaeon HR04]|nr:hypothetical protein HRbin04_00378 [archaeon HR04]
MDIGTIARIYAIGYMLEPIKVRFRKGIKINMLEMMLEASEDESRMLPRWLARILHANGIADVQEQDMGIELLRALSREKIAGEQLTAVKHDFYIGLKEFISRQHAANRDRLMVSLQDIVTLRLKKIMDYSGKLRVTSSNITPEIEQRLSVEERALFRALHDAVSIFRGYILDGGEGEVKR